MHSPTLNIFGTFFPSWMLCAVMGIVGAVLVFKLLSALKIDPWLCYESPQSASGGAPAVPRSLRDHSPAIPGEPFQRSEFFPGRTGRAR